MATAVCAVSLNFYETRKFLSTTSKFLGLMNPARKKMLSAGLRWASRWESIAVSVGPALPARRKERNDFCLRREVGRGNTILNFLTLRLICVDTEAL